MKTKAHLWLLLALPAMLSAAPKPVAPSADVSADPTRAALVTDALARRPEVAQAQALAQAESHRAEAASALPDPNVGVGVQNDSFTAWTVGQMETSYYYASISQTFPWPGRRGLRQESARARRQWAEANADRARLSTVAEVERAYVDLLLARGRLQLLARLESVWKDAEAAARVRYEVGQGAQSDFLRAQLERNRLRQRRYDLEAAEQSALAALNRLRVAAPDSAVETPVELSAYADPVLPAAQAAAAEAEAKSPELAAARALVEQARHERALAEQNVYPDLTVNAQVMPRGGDFPTMWQLGVSAPVPVWAKTKQYELIAEARARQTAAEKSEEAARLLLRQRVYERMAALTAAVQSNQLYRSGLLAQSEAAAASVLAQYRVGGATFLSVLEAWSGYLADEDGFLQSVSAARKIQSAMDEVSLEPAGGGATVPAMGAGAAQPAESGAPAGAGGRM